MSEEDTNLVIERVAALLKKHRRERYAKRMLASDDLIDTGNAREIVKAIGGGSGYEG